MYSRLVFVLIFFMASSCSKKIDVGSESQLLDKNFTREVHLMNKNINKNKSYIITTEEMELLREDSILSDDEISQLSKISL